MWALSDKTIGQWLEYRAKHTPDKEFIVYSDLDMRWTYSQFNNRVDSLAKGLLAMGVKKGTHVGVWASNVPDMEHHVFCLLQNWSHHYYN
jgi:fatty-acyl-CoA synthase